MKKNQSKKRNNIISIFGMCIGVFLLFILAKNFNDAEMIIKKAGIAGPLAALFLYALFAPTPVTTDPITIICGAIYGPVVGTGIAWMGNNIAALVEYFMGTHIRKSTDFEKERDKLPFGLGKLPINSIPVLTLGRMIPFYGSKVISILAGMYSVPIKRFIWTSALINLTGALMMALGGHYIFRIFQL